MTVNAGDPITTLQSALNAYTAAQEAVVAEAKKLKDPAPTVEPPTVLQRAEEMLNAIPPKY